MWEKAVPAEWTEREVTFLLDVLNCAPRSSILDAPCGYGRHAVGLAKRGFQLTGIDISAEYIAKLAQQVNKEQLPIQLMHADIITTQFEHFFDGAYCMGNSFGYVDYEGMVDFVRNVSSALKPGARFVINSGLLAESVLAHFPKTGHYELSDLTVDINNSYVVTESCMVTELTYTINERIDKQRFKHYVYTLSEVKRLLASCGLHVLAVYNSTDKQPYQLGDHQAYIVAEKV